MEGIRGRGGGGRGGGGHGGRGRGGRGRGGHRRGGRRWYGGNLRSRYRPPPVVRYSPDYYTYNIKETRSDS